MRLTENQIEVIEEIVGEIEPLLKEPIHLYWEEETALPEIVIPLKLEENAELVKTTLQDNLVSKGFKVNQQYWLEIDADSENIDIQVFVDFNRFEKEKAIEFVNQISTTVEKFI